MLFVVGEEYTIRFALVAAGKTDTPDLNHIETEATVGVTFTDGDRFTVNGSAAFTIPMPGEGAYTLVAYIATTDGIRTSAYQAVAFPTLTEAEVRQGNQKAMLTKASDGSATMTVTRVQEIQVTLEGTAYTRTTMTEALSQEIYKYAFVANGAVLESLQADGSWKALSDTKLDSTQDGVQQGEDSATNSSASTTAEPTLPSGSYRMRYEIINGEQVEEGHVYTIYTAA